MKYLLHCRQLFLLVKSPVQLLLDILSVWWFFSFSSLFTTTLHLLLHVILGVFILAVTEAIAGAIQIISSKPLNLSPH